MFVIRKNKRASSASFPTFTGPALLILAAALVPALARAATLAAWVQLGENETVSARAIVDGDSCPTLFADGAPLKMKLRSDPQIRFGHVPPDARFPVRGCEVDVKDNKASLFIGKESLPVPRHELRRIVIFGDTGCRIKKSKKEFELQDCLDEAAWPYRKIVEHAAAARPDLVIHVGDYHYREDQCPRTREGCKGPWGYGWDAWYADFFSPSKRLFAAAPWVMVRGNHEDCDRAGEGWFRFLDHAPMERKCRDFTGFFVIKRNNLGLMVMDGAKAEDPDGESKELLKTQLINLLRDQFIEAKSKMPTETESWLLTHRPLSALRYKKSAGFGVENKIQHEAIGDDLGPAVQMVVSGHIHLFEALSFAGPPPRPPQLVVGTGGDNLEDIPPQQTTGIDVHDHGWKITKGLTFTRFGYMVWDSDGAAWKGTVFDEDGRPLAHCTLLKRELDCSEGEAGR
jgi:predicted phosphodiesterase